MINSKFKTHSVNKITQSGFTLIEVMVSLLVFAVGMLGVTYQMSQGVKNTINTEIHSSVMQVALQSIEPLKNSVSDLTAFQTALTNLNTDGTTPAFAGNSNQANFTIAIESATDDVANNDLLAEDADTSIWTAPFTVVLKISYDTLIAFDSDDTSVTTLDFYTTHVLAP